jgi:hypothetical protein
MTTRITSKQRIVLLISFASFMGSGMMALVKVNQTVTSPPPLAAETSVSPESALKEQIRGYEIVLKREPMNQVALEGLVNARLQINDTKGAIEPLEKLVKLYPDRSDYAKQLAEVKKSGNP